MLHQPFTAQLSLLGLLRDIGQEGLEDRLLVALSALQNVIEQVDAWVVTQGEAGRRTLAQRMAQRPRWQSVAEVFTQCLQPHTLRTLERSFCRDDARRPAAARLEPPQLPPVDTHTAAPARQQGLRPVQWQMKGPLSWLAAGLYASSHVAPAAAAWSPGNSAELQEGLISTAPSPRALYHRLALTVGGTALTLAGIGATTWMLRASSPSELEPANVRDQSRLLHYLDHLHCADGDSALEVALWRIAGSGMGQDTADDLFNDVDPRLLADAITCGVKLDAWLDLWIERDTHDATDPATTKPAPFTVHRVERAAEVRQYPMQPKGPLRSQLHIQCQAIRPRQQSLASVEAAIAAIDTDASVADLWAEHLDTARTCLVRVDADLEAVLDQLVNRLTSLWFSVGTPMGDELLQFRALNDLIARTGIATSRVTARREQVDQRIAARDASSALSSNQG